MNLKLIHLNLMTCPLIQPPIIEEEKDNYDETDGTYKEMVGQ